MVLFFIACVFNKCYTDSPENLAEIRENRRKQLRTAVTLFAGERDKILAFDASTVLLVVCWGASDPKEPAAGSRSCCVFLACSSTVLGFVSQPDTYIKSSSAYAIYVRSNLKTSILHPAGV